MEIVDYDLIKKTTMKEKDGYYEEGGGISLPVVLKLFGERKISLRKAAEISGLNDNEFINIFLESNTPWDRSRGTKWMWDIFSLNGMDFN